MTVRFTVSGTPLATEALTLDVTDERAGEYAEALELLSERTGVDAWADAKMERVDAPATCGTIEPGTRSRAFGLGHA